MCIDNDAYPASLEARKVYQTMPDAQGDKHGLVRVIDESGEDYLYPKKLFVALKLPRSAAMAVRSASAGAASIESQ